MKKKKLIIIIIIAVVVLAAAAMAFLILTGRLFGGKEDEVSSSSAVSSSATSVVLSGSQSGVEPASEVTATPDNNPSLFFEGHYYFQNLTGQTLSEIRIAPAGTQNWEDNLLGEESLANGETWLQSLMLRDLGGTWDLRVKDANGGELLFTDLNLSDNRNFVLTIDGGQTLVRQG